VTAFTTTVEPVIAPDLTPDRKVKVPAFAAKQGLIALLQPHTVFLV
jgi:hypothetical protein